MLSSIGGPGDYIEELVAPISVLASIVGWPTVRSFKMLDTNVVESIVSLGASFSQDSAFHVANESTLLADQEIEMKTPILDMDTNERQRLYVESQKSKGAGLGVVFQNAFISGMRDIGYKNPAWAMAELIDNAIQASAKAVEVRFDFDASNKTQAKPDQVALIDDGAGMIPEMISYAVRWGGTDREGDRHGFGRFGFGLPSASVSMASRYTVYSKVRDGDWFAVTIDLAELAKLGGDATKTDEALQPRSAQLPMWLLNKPKVGMEVASLASGTIIVLEDLDRLRKLNGWITTKSLKAKLLDYFGVIYRHWVSDIQIVIDGSKCEAVDPLFLLPHGRNHAETRVMAKAVKTSAFEVTTDSGKTGLVRIRASILHPQFGWANPDDLATGSRKNKRWDVLRRDEYNGLIICREGRQIDVVTPPWTKFQNNDRYIKIEVDFDPALDEYFGVTTSKQQIMIDDVMWEKLKSAGKEAGNLISLVKEMRAEWDSKNDSLKAAQENLVSKVEAPLPSGDAMLAAEKFKTRTPHLTPEKRDEAERNLKNKIEEEVRTTGKSVEEAKREVEEHIARRPWDIEFKAMGESPFYSPKRLGVQKVITINTSHPFYTKVYNEATMDRSAWEVLMFVLADGEIDAGGERAVFYKAERINWSEMLRHALDHLVTDSTVVDRHASIVESQEVEGAEAESAS